jgi:nucleoside-diphosphate-sugar epimerase
VTGAAGFVGSCLTRRLAATGHETHAFLLQSTNRWRLTEGFESIRFHEVNVRDSQAVREALRSIQPSVIIHLAAHGQYAYQHDRTKMFETNVLGTLNLLTSAEESGTSLFLNAGSSSEYGAKNHPLAEVDHLAPDRVYGVSKASQSLLAMQMGRTSRMAIVTCRFFSVYGPWDDPSKMVPRLVAHASKGIPLEISSPHVARDLVFVEDVADVLLDFDRLSRFSGEVFNVGSGIQTTFGMLVEHIKKLFGSRVVVSWNRALLNSWDTASWCADMTKTSEVLGWNPKYNVHEGLELTAKWLMEHADVWSMK